MAVMLRSKNLKRGNVLDRKSRHANIVNARKNKLNLDERPLGKKVNLKIEPSDMGTFFSKQIQFSTSICSNLNMFVIKITKHVFYKFVISVQLACFDISGKSKY